MVKFFFEIHDPTEKNQQGPDRGLQYRSAAFYFSLEQKQIIMQWVNELKQLGYDVMTEVTPVSLFYPAEAYHQNYYQRTQGQPYCHSYTKRFKD
ncbi:MAG: hypothetical protein EBZ47_02925 [Chlamydiae bacterium]|nr:hypothetical protein [Chlamydiota bacterium]